MVRRISSWIIGNRLAVLVGIFFITLFLGSQITKITIRTHFDDLLPQGHPYIQVHNKYEKQLGAPFKVYLMLKVQNGDVYNQDTLQKVKDITNQLDLIPGVDHNQIYSIGSRKVKKITVGPETIVVENLMEKVPDSTSAMEEFKETVRNARGVYGIWVSRDEKSLLFSASFVPRLLDFNLLLNKTKELQTTYADSNHEIYIAGEPLLTGWVYFYQKEMYMIFAFTLSVLMLLLYVYFRNLVGFVVPILSTVLGAIWGLGFTGLLGYDLEPLTLVIPLLIAARALSHSVQITERYFECYEEYKDVKSACIECASSILPPGILGILTDAIGILLIAVAPIPMMQKLAYVCAFWASSIILSGLVFTPVVISFFKPPKNTRDIVDTERGVTQKILGLIAWLGYGKAGMTTVVGAVLLAAATGWFASKVNIGDINPGTPILWPDSFYNVSIREINTFFPGTEELYVILEGDEIEAVPRYDFLNVLDLFQRHMEEKIKGVRTLSAYDFLPPINKNLFGGYFKWDTIPTSLEKSTQLFFLLTRTSAPNDFDLYFSRDLKNANIIISLKDHTGDTIRNTLRVVNEFIEENEDLVAQAKATFKLASGNIGVLAAINETVTQSQFLNFFLVMSVIFVLCSITYRSMVAAIILMIPLNLTNLITLSVMKGLGIGLNINTLPIISVGVGVGIDYGIYLLSRICEEYQKEQQYSLITATNAIKTTGKAIFFTATTMIGGVIFWFFLSSLRFQAEMGLLLAIIMFVNMIGALLLIPAIVYSFKPRFLARTKLLIRS